MSGMNLGSLLKMLGVRIPPETVAQIEALLPQLPQKIQQVIGLVNAAVKNFDERLTRMEAQQNGQTAILLSILEKVNEQYGDGDSVRPSGAGANQRQLESVGIGSD